MGIHMQYVKALEKRGLFSPRSRILDIGSSNLYGARAGEVFDFIKTLRAEMDADTTKAFAQELAAGSEFAPGQGWTNQSFIGQMFEAAGLEYLAFDIAKGYRTHVLDMNHMPLPGQYKGYFDLVLNFGTTEHIFNQFNSFKVIHEATKVGGFMVHQVPSIGFTDHCYFTYTGRFFFDLAGYNEYEVVDFWFTGPGGEANLFESVTNYASYFPILGEYQKAELAKGAQSALNQVHIPNIAITIVYRKKTNKPFMGAVECQTSVGEIPDEVRANYHTGPNSNQSSTEPSIPQPLTPAVLVPEKKNVIATTFKKITQFFRAAG